jgi:hypothetical protein
VNRLTALQLMLILGGTPAALPAQYAKPIASYDIKARLDHDKRTIEGSQVLTWHNDSRDTVPTLQFHLYMNAFKNEKSTFMRESGGQLRSDRMKKTEWGSIDIKRLQIVGGADLTQAIRFIQPDDGNADDQTVIEVALPQPVKPGQTIQVAADFVTKLPRVFARTGFHGDFYLVGQWFPKLGVWETAGFRYSTKGAWNCHQFHAHSEFFANYGDYRVELTVPRQFVVGATGMELSRREDPGAPTTTYVYQQPGVTDFAWTAQPSYVKVERQFVAAKETSAAEVAAAAKLHGIPEDEARLQDVKMTLLIQPEHADQIDRHFKALTTAIKYFGLWYGKYPYATITCVDPPFGGGGAGGMEYPTFITAGTSWRAPAKVHNPEMVIVHEFGHQFWMQLVATNEFEESWLDEGFNTYSTTKILDYAYGPMALPIRAFGFTLYEWFDLPRLKGDSIDRSAYLLSPVTDDLVRNSWSYYDTTSYGVNSYMRTGVTLRTLENILGAEVMARLMRTYHQRYRFAHPTSHDFARVVDEVSGRDMKWFFDQFVFGNRLLDYRVAECECEKIGVYKGIFDLGGKRVTVDLKQAEEEEEAREKDKNFKPRYRCRVAVRREGDAQAPVELNVKFKDGSVETRHWDGQYRWVRYEFEEQSEIEWAEIDPQNKLLLDVNFANNSHTKEAQTAPLLKWSANLLFWAQNALLWLGSIM